MDSSSTCTNQPLIPIVTLLDHSSSEMDLVAHAERQVEATLDNLVAMRALQKSNQMDINSLLNPEGESHVLTEMSDVEIYQAVVDAITACANMEANSGDDCDDIPFVPCPT